jgi:hypothetical protein
MSNKRTRSQVKEENERLNKKSKATTEQVRWENSTLEEKISEIANLNQDQKKIHFAFQYDVDTWDEENLVKILARVLNNDFFVKTKSKNVILYGDSILNLEILCQQIGRYLSMVTYRSADIDTLAYMEKGMKKNYKIYNFCELYDKIDSICTRLFPMDGR